MGLINYPRRRLFMKKILVLAVHPDDETLGCGGTLLKYKALGTTIGSLELK